MIRVGNTGLRCELIVPDKNEIKRRKIIAKVFDGKETVEYTFGPNVPIERIMKLIPKCYIDTLFAPTHKVKGIIHGDITEVKIGDEATEAIVLPDGSVIVRS